MNRKEQNDLFGLRVLTVAVPENAVIDVLTAAHMARCDHLDNLAQTGDRAVLEAMAARNRSRDTTGDQREAWESLTHFQAKHLLFIHDDSYRMAVKRNNQALLATDSDEALRKSAQAFAYAQRHKATRDLLNHLLEKETNQ